MAPKASETYKIITLGDLGVGKSSLIQTYVEGKFPREVKGSISEEIKTLHRESKTVELEIHDTGGQERFSNSLTPAYYRRADGCLLCFDVSNEESLNSCKTWLASLEHRTERPDEIAVILVGLKSDRRGQTSFDIGIKQKSEEECEEFANSTGLKYIEVSALNNTQVHNVFDKLVTEIDRKRKEFQMMRSEIQRQRDKSFQISGSGQEEPTKQKTQCCLVK